MHGGRASGVGSTLVRGKGRCFDPTKMVCSSGDGGNNGALLSGSRHPGIKSGESSDYRTGFQHNRKNDCAREGGAPRDLTSQSLRRSTECDTTLSPDRDAHASPFASGVFGQYENTARLRSIAPPLLRSAAYDSTSAAASDASEDSACSANFGGNGGTGNSDRVRGGRRKRGDVSDEQKEKGSLHEQKVTNEELKYSLSLENSDEDKPRYGTLVLLPLGHGFSSGDTRSDGGSDDSGADDWVAGRGVRGGLTRVGGDGGLVDCCREPSDSSDDEYESSDDDLGEEQSVADVTDSLDFLCNVSVISRKLSRASIVHLRHTPPAPDDTNIRINNRTSSTCEVIWLERKTPWLTFGGLSESSKLSIVDLCFVRLEPCPSNFLNKCVARRCCITCCFIDIPCTSAIFRV